MIYKYRYMKLEVLIIQIADSSTYCAITVNAWKVNWRGSGAIYHAL